VSVTRLALTDFRNHASALIAPGAGFVLLSGDNGAGKTNVLEAVSLLAPGRGLRGASLSEMARSDGPGGFSVAAQLTPLPAQGGDQGVGANVRKPKDPCAAKEGSEAGSIEFPSSLTHAQPLPVREGGISIGTGTLATAPERRQVRINGAPASVNSLGEWLSVLWLTPAMDRLFTGPAGDRRRFLDRLVLALEPGHAHHSARYEAAMRARNKLLTEPDRVDADWLSALEAQMAEHGAEVSAARARTIAGLTDALHGPGDDRFPRAAIALDGWNDAHFGVTLLANRARDAAAGRATEGPHRQDLAVRHQAKDQPAARSSTGEQKALLLGLVLAHAELVAARRGAAPILLLDEVAAHLDPARREALFDRLEGRGQVWMTATEHSLFAGIASASRFHVDSGRISPA
jgi:DNA replication and repair protein RecF